ncbi:VAC8 [Symbiodinium natans]|uniref:VAC8 protein n=1 Tax=Symbiodinium natans TaxID=878477 RepID=A0A812RRW4_9DINO|nr:VAC8 [Symbiodinium natans]
MLHSKAIVRLPRVTQTHTALAAVHCMTWGSAHDSLQAVASMEALLTSDDVRARFVAAGAVQPLVAMLSDNSRDARCKAAKALANLGHCAVGKRILVTTGGVPALMKLFATDDPECEEAASAVLVHVAAGEKVREELILGGMPPYLTAMLDSNSPTTLAHAVRLLGHLATNQDVASGLFEGFLSNLLSFLDSSYPDEVNLPAAFAIAQLASTDTRRRALIESQIVEKLLRLLDEGSHDCKAEAAGALAVLTQTQDKRTFKKIAAHMMDAGVLTPLLVMLSSSHEACGANAARVLVLLAATGRTSAAMLASGILRHLVEQLRAPSTSAHSERLARVLQALAKFNRSEMELELSQESGQELLLAALQKEQDRNPAPLKVEKPRPPMTGKGQVTVLPMLSKLKSGRKMLPMDTIIRTPRKLPAGAAPLPPLHCFY